MDQILKAISSAAEPGIIRRYPVTADVIRRLAGYAHREPEQLVITPGSDATIRLICQHFAVRREGGAPVILQDPNYVAWEQACGVLGLPLHRVPANVAEQGGQDGALLQAARQASHALIAVSRPNGILGNCPDPNVVEELAEVSRERGHLLVIDSCYQAFHGPWDEIIRRAGGPVLAIQSLSKSHGLAGLRLALLCGEPRLLTALAAGPLEHCVAAPSLQILDAVLDFHPELEDIWSDIKASRSRASRMLEEWGWHPLPSGGNFLTVGLGSAEHANSTTRQLSARGFRIRDLSSLPDLAGYLRFTVTDARMAEVFLPALRDSLPALEEAAC